MLIAPNFAIGAILSQFVSTITMSYSTLSIVVAVLSSTLIGVAFGFFPARSASKLDPVDALARE